MIYPGAVWRPGVNAGYRQGRTSMVSAVAHYTVGYDSRPVGDKGFFNFLVSRDGTVTQFAEADAVCWHAGDPWNSRGPGIEVEYLDEPTIFTPEALTACAALIAWLPIAKDFYDGPRVTDHVGYITHRSLIQTGDQHFDYWPQEAWDAMTATTLEQEFGMEYLVKNTDDGQWWYFPPFGEPAEKVDPAFVLARASFMPHGDSNGPTIVELDKRHRSSRKQFVKDIAAAVPASGTPADPGPLKVVLSGTATPA